MSEIQKPSEEQVKKLHTIFEPVSKAMEALSEIQSREAGLAITRLQEGMMWAQQAILYPVNN